MSVDSLAGYVASGSGPVALAVSFAGGLLAGFGPCVLPMMPAVFGYVTGHSLAEDGAAGGRPTLRALALSAAFVLGMSSVFTALGVVAGALGRAVVPGAWAYYALAAVCLVLGLHMLDVLALPFDRLNRFVPLGRRTGAGGAWGALALGALFGLVASPCSTPVLAAIAALAAAGRDPVAGGVLLFAFGLGKGVPLLLLGLLSGSLPAMRSLAGLTTALSRVAGAALLGTSVYLVWIA